MQPAAVTSDAESPGPAHITGAGSEGVGGVRTDRWNADKQQRREGDETSTTGDGVYYSAQKTCDE